MIGYILILSRAISLKIARKLLVKFMNWLYNYISELIANPTNAENMRYVITLFH